MNLNELEFLGEPDLVIAGLKIWIHGRQFPDSTDYWDGNWLRVTAYCNSPNAMVKTGGPIIHLGEISGLLKGCEQLYSSLNGEAGLDCMEQELNVKLRAESGGSIKTKISVISNRLRDSHEFTYDIDQSYLPAIISACSNILEKYPIREDTNLPKLN
jgi:hypothetical protein